MTAGSKTPPHRAETALRETEMWLAAQKEAFQAAMNGTPLAASLGILTRAVAAEADGRRAAFYIVDDQEKALRHVVGMSDAYAQAVDGSAISPESLACGLAVATGEPVITRDVETDERWRNWTWLAREYGYRGCWSFPVETATGQLIGSFALYFPEPREAQPRDLKLASAMTQTAAIIISHHWENEERARAEAALRQSEARFRALATVGKSSVYSMSPDWREMRRLDGVGFLVDTDNPTTAWIDTYIPPDERPRVLEEIDRAIGAKSVFELEHRVRGADGTVGWTFSRAIPLLDDAGEIVEWFGAATDVTSRVQADQRFTRLFQASPAPFLVIKPDAPRFTIAEVNDAYLAATMRKRDEVVGRGIFEAFPDNPGDATIEGVSTLRASIERVLASHQPARLPGLKYDIARPDGTFEERWWSPVNSPVLDQNGEIEAIIHNANDVTEEYRAQAALRASEERYRSLFERIDEAFCIIEVMFEGEKAVDFLFLEVNPAFERHTGIANAKGRRIREIAPHHEEHWFKTYGEVALSGQTKRFEASAEQLDKRWFDVNAFRVGEPAQRRVAIVFSDITQRQRDAAALRESEMRLLEADRQKDEFLAMLAHELRNPLASIGNASELLGRVITSGSPADPALRLLKRQSKQLARLVDDLMDISRIARGRITLDEVAVDIGDMVDRAVETVQAVMGEKSHHFVVAKPQVPVYVRGDMGRLTQAIGNVLHNAAKYTDPGGEIRLEVRDSAEEVDIAVTDNGAGISAELLPHVFDLFVQSERTLDRSQGGLGIGLSVVKRLIDLQHGSVSVASSGLGHGSTFAISLPRIAAPEVAGKAAVPVQIPSKRVLVVDDNVDAADSLAMLLKLDNHEVHTVYGAEDAIEAAQRLRPDVILLDIGLPEMDGFEVARRVRRGDLNPRPRLVALTGYGRQEDKDRARESGFDGHIVKPVSPEALEMLFAVPMGRINSDSKSEDKSRVED